MQARIGTALAAFFLAVFLSCAAAAADYASGWGRGLTDREAAARRELKVAAAALLTPEDGEAETVRKLNRYVCDGAKYDYGMTASGLADFVEEGRAVCSGYAGALSYLLDCAGIKNMTVTSFVETPDGAALHMWNAVYIDGQWLHADPTWNDATRSARRPDGAYFLLDGDAMRAARPALTLQESGDYDHLYELIRTASLVFRAGEAGAGGCVLEDGQLLAPLERLYALGAYIKQEDGAVSIVLGTETLRLAAGQDAGHLDGAEFFFDVLPRITADGVVLIPVRAVCEKLGAAVSYDAATGNVTVSYDPCPGAS